MHPCALQLRVLPCGFESGGGRLAYDLGISESPVGALKALLKGAPRRELLLTI